MLKITSLCASYDSVKAIDDVSLRIEKGECVALVGGNGSGKSTILKSICGLIRPESGCIEIEGINVDNISPSKRVSAGIVYVPEGRRVFPEMSVMENLEIGAYSPEARKLKNESIELVFSLFPKLKIRSAQRGSTLSGGEQQMLAIGRGMMSRPKLLMLDEPSLGLAPVIVDEVYENLSQIHKNGVSILIVEENIYRAFSVAGRGYVLENGKVALVGEGQELLNNPEIIEAYMGT